MKHNDVIPYEKSEKGKKTQVTNMFDNIAPYYDLLNKVLSLGVDKSWRKKAIASIKSIPHESVLDIATGTADMALEMANTLDCKEIVGLDISPNMIEIGNKKVAKNNLSELISLEVGDSEDMRFEEEVFDAATVAFGVRNFENLEAGLKEINRVLKKGGKLVVLEFSKPTIFPFKQLFNSYFKYILPTIGRFTSKDPKAYKYLYESVQAFPDYDDFADVMRNCGFKNLTWKALTLGICTIYWGEK